jgi:peptidyl-prolyl cis-trans isomerase A (cyclophilin A)/peptidyl-prolyl cis-trans isomerase B (cyclophilin B)
MLKRLLFVLAAFMPALVLAAPPQVEIKTNLGDITLELYPDKAPGTVKNFLEYVKAGHYDGTVFHRVIDGFMIQGGGFDLRLEEKPTRPPIKNEAANGLRNDIYTVAMARTSEPHSAAAQFFISVANNDFLNYRSPDVRGYGYAVFGKVVKGQDVVTKIAKVRTGGMGPFPSDVPAKPVVMEKVRVVSAPAGK